MYAPYDDKLALAKIPIYTKSRWFSVSERFEFSLSPFYKPALIGKPCFILLVKSIDELLSISLGQSQEKNILKAGEILLIHSIRVVPLLYFS